MSKRLVMSTYVLRSIGSGTIFVHAFLKPGHGAVLDGEQAQEDQVDDQRLTEGACLAGVDTFGDADIADKPDRVKKRDEENDVGHDSIAQRDEFVHGKVPSV